MNPSLNCQSITISMHALKAMIQRGITVDEVIEVAENGEIIVVIHPINLIRVV